MPKMCVKGLMLGTFFACTASAAGRHRRPLHRTSSSASSTLFTPVPPGPSEQRVRNGEEHAVHRGASEEMPRGNRNRRWRRRSVTSRHRQLFDGDDLASQQTQPLEEGYGTHFAYVWVGTPPQRQSVILDTGSTKTAFPCDPCDECGKYLKYHESGPFIPTQSSTYVLVESNPGWSAHYSEGDGWEANIVKDMTWLGGTAVNDIFGADQRSIFFKFGCMTKLTGLFVTQLADGIMGLGFASSESYVSNLKIGGAVERDAFSLCFTHEGGTMSLGGPSTPNHLTSMQYAAMGKQGSHFWGVHWLDLRIIPSPFALHSPSSDVHDDDIECMTSESGSITDCGASPSDFGGRFKTIVDSGTTWTYVPTKLKEAFCKRWLDVVGWEYQTDTSIDLTVDISTLPDIVFVLEGKDEGTDVHVSVGPRQYLDEYCQYIDDDSPELGMQCYYFLSIIFEGSTQILGANFMADKDVYFDSEDEVIGFADANCSWTEPLRTNPTSQPSSTAMPSITPAPSAPSQSPSPQPSWVSISDGETHTESESAGSNGSDPRTASVLIAVSVLLSTCIIMACAFGVTNALRRHRERVKEERLARQHGEMPPSVGGMADIPLFDRVVIAVAELPCVKRVGMAVQNRLSSGTGRGGRPNKRRFERLGDDEDAETGPTVAGSATEQDDEGDDIDACVDVRLPAHGGLSMTKTQRKQESNSEETIVLHPETELPPLGSSLSKQTTVASTVFNPFRSSGLDATATRPGEGSEF